MSVRSVLSLSLVLFGPTAWAESQTAGSDLAALQAAQERQERMAAIEADRSSVVAEIVARFAGRTDDGGAELQRALARVSADVVLKVSEAKSMREVDSAIFGKSGGVSPNSLGAPDSDLVFFPLTPCRLVDTRLAGGILAAGVPRDFDSNASNLSGQGGNAAGCGVNDPDPAALAVTITAVNPQGAGNLRAWPLLAAVPTASAVNYGLPGQGLNLANTTILPILQSGAQTNEFTVRADVSAVHVVIDVVGYFFSPNSTAHQCQVMTANQVVANAAQISIPGLGSPACPAGFTLTGGGQNYRGAITGWSWWDSTPDLAAGRWFTAGRNETGGNVTVNVFGICCRVPGR
jgi:hypothetical protein